MDDKDQLDSTSSDSVEIEATEAKKKNKRDHVAFWKKWVPAAKFAAQRHWNDSRRAWREYDGDTERSYAENSRRTYDEGVLGNAERYPIYWSRIKTIESAFYSRTPETFARRVFGSEDDLSMTMALIVDRVGRYLIANGDFDAAIKASVQDYINADKTTVQVCYYYREDKVKKVKEAIQDASNPQQFVDKETGEPVLEEIFQTPEGGFIYDAEEDELQEQQIKVKPVVYDQVIHTPTAKMPEEIEDMAYYFCMTKAEAIERFGEEKVKSWPDNVWKSVRSFDKERRESEATDRANPDKFIEGWEIWSAVTKKLYWYCPDYQDDFLDEPKDDPYKLKGFFPSPRFIIGTKPAKSLYPTPVFVRLWPTLNMLHMMYGRVFELIDAVRRRALVDGTSDELIEALNDIGNTEFIAVQNMASLVEKGGLDGLMWYIPVQDLVNAIGELNQQDEKFKENIDEWFGTPAILQGTGDPIETATAQEIKVSAAHDRFKNQKNSVAEMARETLEIMIDLAFQVWDNNKFMAVTGFKYMDQLDRQQFPAALAALKSDTERGIRIEIDTDTTSYVGEQIRMQQRTAVVQTLMKGLAEVSGMMEQSPTMGELAVKIMMESLAGLPGGAQFIDETRRAMQEMMQKQQEPQPEPPPDPAMIKVQVDQFRAETDRMKLEAQAAKEELNTLKDAFDSQLKQQKQEFDQYIQQKYLEIDGGRLMIEADNKQADNQRLEVDSQAKLIEAAKPAAPEGKGSESPTNIIINAPSAVPETPSVIDEILKGNI